MEDREMHKAKCSDCGQECEVPFKPTEGKPVRCQECFRKNRPQRSGNRSFNDRGSRRFDSRPREMHKAVCAECKKECEVPFKPTADKPVYCRECFMKRKSQETQDESIEEAGSDF